MNNAKVNITFVAVCLLRAVILIPLLWVMKAAYFLAEKAEGLLDTLSEKLPAPVFPTVPRTTPVDPLEDI